ncbi:MAG TPA: trypsin-like peptidase domain-containing protein [Candidatus Eremiobacteraceae bacterium]|nr:trypsin-like peptidase domain-containing protein [Candidatus Eremiobacteraceae bacterium]
MKDWPPYKSPHGVTSRQRDFGSQIIRMAGLYSSAIIISAPDGTDFHSASGFLMKLADQTFLVTNAHVVQKYREVKSARGEALLEFGGRSITPHIVDEVYTDFVDIATLDVDGVDFERASKGYWSSGITLEAYAPSAWPIDAPKKGEPIVTVGWPAKLRVHEGGPDVEFAAFSMTGMAIDAVEDGWFAVPFEREHWTSTENDVAHPAVSETEFGGTSGSPVFVLHRSKLEPLHLVGLNNAYGKELDLLYCTRTDLIATDGTIARR